MCPLRVVARLTLLRLFMRMCHRLRTCQKERTTPVYRVSQKSKPLPKYSQTLLKPVNKIKFVYKVSVYKRIIKILHSVCLLNSLCVT